MSRFQYDLVQLRYLQAIVACESFTAAAKQLRVSQPTLSHAIGLLEARLKTPLLLRGPRGVVPTASGRALAAAADDVFVRLQRADDSVRDLEAAPAGHFTLGCYHSFGAMFLPAFVVALAKRAPAIEIALWEGIGSRIVDAAVERTVSFAIGVSSSAPRPHPDLVVVPMFRDAVCVVRSTAAPKGRRGANAQTLFHVPRITPSERVVAALRTRGELPARVVPCGDLELVKSFVLAGAGLGVLPWRVAIHETPRGALALAGDRLPFEVDVGCVYYRGDMHRTRGAAIVREEIIARGKVLDELELPYGVAPIAKRRYS